MTLLADGSGPPLPSLSGQFTPDAVSMDLTMCGLLVERAEQLANLYAENGNWNDVKDVWFDNRLSNRSTRGSAQKIYRVLTSRFKNAPSSLPNPSVLPTLFDMCQTERDKAQILYLYLVSDDPLVQYVVHEYVSRLTDDRQEPLDFTNEEITDILSQLEYSDGTSFEYADSTIERWCVGFRSVMRACGVLNDTRSTVGEPPSVGDIPLLVAMDYSYETDDEWLTAPRGLLYLFQPEDRCEELFDRSASTDAWKYLELHGDLELRPTNEPYSWINNRGEI